MWQRWHSQACAEPAAEGASPFWLSGRQPCSPRGSWIPAVTTEDKLRTRAFPGVCLCPFASVPGATEGKGQAWGQCVGGGACLAQGPQKVTDQAWGQCGGGHTHPRGHRRLPVRPGVSVGGAYPPQGPQKVTGQAWGQCRGGIPTPGATEGQAWGQCRGGIRIPGATDGHGSGLGSVWGGAHPAQGPQTVTGQAWGQCVGGWRAHPRCRLTGSALGQLLWLLWIFRAV